MRRFSDISTTPLFLIAPNATKTSIAEAASAIDVAVAFRLMAKEDGDEIQDKLLQVAKMLYKLK